MPTMNATVIPVSRVTAPVAWLTAELGIELQPGALPPIPASRLDTPSVRNSLFRSIRTPLINSSPPAQNTRLMMATSVTARIPGSWDVTTPQSTRARSSSPMGGQAEPAGMPANRRPDAEASARGMSSAKSVAWQTPIATTADPGRMR